MHLRRSLAVLLLLAGAPVRADEPVRVFAAASLSGALNDIAQGWRQSGHAAPNLVYAASSTLARQIEAGAPADVFAAADLAWMDYLEERGRIAAATRRNLVGNELVLVVPRGHRLAIEVRPGFDIGKAFAGKLCTGEPGVVPLGTYARQSLEHLGWWDALSARIVGTDDARAALAFVERGECALGIGYATDATASARVEIVGRFPADSHQRIIYPVALVTDARPAAAEFLGYLESPEATAVFTRHGFAVLR